MDTFDPGRLIDVGKADDEFRLYLASEKLRQTELRLAHQQGNLQAAEARATSVLGWAVTAMSALAVVLLNTHYRRFALVPALLLFAAAVLCVISLRPKKWNGSGYTPNDLDSMDVGSELELKERMAAGFDSGAADNTRTLNLIGRCMTAAWLLLIAAPLAGILAILAG